MTISVLLVDDHPLFRKGLRLTIEAEPDLVVVGEARDGKEAIEKTRKLSPDVVVMDITMPNMTGIEATQQILVNSPHTKVVALSIHAAKRFVMDMLRAGARGYILKDSAPEDLVNGIRTAVQGEVFLSPSITGVVVSELKELMLKSHSNGPEEDMPPILSTKLRRPVLSPDLVPRLDLVARLDELRRRPLTMVSSAAGYGKSTIASLWLEAWDGPYAWLTLGESENDLRMFITYLRAAIGNAFPGTCDRVRSLLQASELPPVSDLSRHLMNDIDRIEDPFILVLDDFHHMHETTVHELVDALLTYPLSNMHLMLLTRRDPPLLTSALRARDLLNEIGMSDLRFSVAETRAFLEATLGQTVKEKTAATIQESLEGWPVGLRLISIHLKKSGDLDNLLVSLRGGFATILDFLVTEVLSHQSPEMAKMMTATAILDHFSAPLCDALYELDSTSDAGRLNGAEFIARLKKDNLFLIALDTENRWFRFHHLFRQLLQDRLNRHWCPEQIAALHSRASAWFAENDITNDAVKQSPVIFGVDQQPVVPETATRQPRSPSPPSQSLVESLTNRELDVLDFLAQRLSNKEIAAKLFISETTVKAHLQNIYGKLNVGNRRDAVEKAQTLGILTQR